MGGKFDVMEGRVVEVIFEARDWVLECCRDVGCGGRECGGLVFDGVV